MSNSIGFNPRILMPELGFPELATMKEDSKKSADVLTASIVGLSMGDFIILHEEYINPDDIKLFGRTDYRDGAVASTIRDASIDCDPLDPNAEMYRFQVVLAEFFTSPNCPYPADLTSTIRVKNDRVEVDDIFVPLNNFPEVVVEYGACLYSRSRILDQFSCLESIGKTFSWLPIYRNHFTNKVVSSGYDTMIGLGTRETMFDKKYYIGREDGVEAATDAIINDQKTNNAPVDIVDVILSVGLEHMTERDTTIGISNATTILRDSGVCIVRGATSPVEDELGIDELVDIAKMNGLTIATSFGYQTTSHLDVKGLLNGKNPMRQVKTVALKKP